MICLLCGGTEHATILSGLHDWEYGIAREGVLERCAKCGLVRLSPLPTPQEIPALYPQDYANKAPPGWLSSLYSAGARRRVESLVGPSGRVLDMGCGRGDWLLSLGGSWERHGTELEAGCAEGIPIHDDTLWLDSGSFDLIRLSHVIEHVPDPMATMSEVARLLRPGGKVIVETPNVRSPAFGLLGRWWGAVHFPRHLHLFCPGTLARLMRSHGITPTATTHTVMPTGWSLGVQNWLSSKVRVPKTFGRMPGYGLLMLACLPLALVQKALGCACMVEMIGEKSR